MELRGKSGITRRILSPLDLESIYVKLWTDFYPEKMWKIYEEEKGEDEKRWSEKIEKEKGDAEKAEGEKKSDKGSKDSERFSAILFGCFVEFLNYLYSNIS